MHYTNMKDVYSSALDDYVKKTQNTAKEYSKFKSLNDQLLIKTKKLKIRIKELYVSLDYEFTITYKSQIFTVILIIQLFIRIK